MLGTETRAGAVAGAHNQRASELAVRHVARLGHFVGDKVPAHRQEIGEHDLGDRPHAGHRRTHRRAEDRFLRNRRIDHPLRAELFQQAHGRLEDAAGGGNVLADKGDPLVAHHLLGDTGGDGFAIAQLRHAQPPSAKTSVVRISCGGSGEAFAISVASSTWRRASSAIC